MTFYTITTLARLMELLIVLYVKHHNISNWRWEPDRGDKPDIIIKQMSGEVVARSGDLIIVNDDGTFFNNMPWLKEIS